MAAKIECFQDYPTYKCKRDCFYYGITTGSCDYLTITGHRRGCPAGATCTKYRKNEGMSRSGTAFNKDRAYSLWQAGKSAAEIADILKCSVSTVYGWMRRKGLPANPPKRKLRTPPEWHAKARQLYDSRKVISDREIAKAVGKTEQSVQLWRKAAGLKAKGRKR